MVDGGWWMVDGKINESVLNPDYAISHRAGDQSW